jgi:CRISPR/Cas system-associated protein endoribonuclease Cas2
LKPEKTLDYLKFLLEKGLIEDAVTVYSTILSDPNSSQQKSRKEMDLEFGQLIADHPESA